MGTNSAHDADESLSRLMARWPAEAHQRPLYRIRDWNHHFEDSNTRKIRRLAFVLVPNKHDGKGYARLTARPEPEQLFASFILLLEIASKSPARGVLADEEGPFTPDDCAVMTRMPARGFERAFDELAGPGIGWLEKLEPSDCSAFLPLGGAKPGESPGNLPETGRSAEKLPARPNGSGEFLTEWKGMEGNGIPPIVPQGGQSEGDGAMSGSQHSRPASSSPEKKKEGGAPESQAAPPRAAEKKSAGGGTERERAGTAAAIDATEKRICELFGRRQLGGGYRTFLAAVSESLPLAEEVWTCFRAMIAARKRSGAEPEDYALRHGWLINADKLAEQLLGAADIARTWWREIGGGGHKAAPSTPAPEQWQKKLRARYPQAEVPADFSELPAEIQQEIRKEAA